MAISYIPASLAVGAFPPGLWAAYLVIVPCLVIGAWIDALIEYRRHHHATPQR